MTYLIVTNGPTVNSSHVLERNTLKKGDNHGK